jgi:hypothetical protein
MIQLLLATKGYMLNRMPNEEDRNVYSMALTHCGEIITASKDADYNVLIDRLLESKLQCKVIKNPWFRQHMPRKQAETAHDNALDIVQTLSRRFITGVSSESRTVHREADVHSKPKPY